MKKILVILLEMSLILGIVLSNISYANTNELTIENLKQSLQKLYNSNQIGKVKFENGMTSSNVKFQVEKNGKGKLLINNSTIKYVSPNYNLEFNTEYYIKNGRCVFNNELSTSEVDNYVKKENISKDESISFAWDIIGIQKNIIDLCYESVADALGVDLSIAYTYLTQNTKNGEMHTDICNYKSNEGNESYGGYYLEIDIEKFSKLDKSQLNEFPYCTIIVEDNNVEEPQQNMFKNNSNEGLKFSNEINTNINENKNQNQMIYIIFLCIIIFLILIIIYIIFKAYKKVSK